MGGQFAIFGSICAYLYLLVPIFLALGAICHTDLLSIDPYEKKGSQFPKIYQHLSVQFLLKKQVHCKSTRLLWLPFNVLVGRFAIKRGVILACFVLYSHPQLGTTLCHRVNQDLSSSHFLLASFFFYQGTRWRRRKEPPHPSGCSPSARRSTAYSQLKYLQSGAEAKQDGSGEK